jgi:hypothetical protein
MAEEAPHPKPADAPSEPAPRSEQAPHAEPASSAPSAPDGQPSFSKKPDPVVEVPGPQTRHERREAKRLAREAGREARETVKEQAQRKRSIATYVVIGLIALAFAVVVIRLLANREPVYVRGSVHWHTKVQLELCGQRLDLPCLQESSGTVHGKDFCGTHEFHHHHDNVIHMEGAFPRREDAYLGRFFDAIGMPFSETQLWNWTDGMTCPNATTPGKVRFLLNGRESSAWRNHTVRDGDTIKVSFG